MTTAPVGASVATLEAGGVGENGVSIREEQTEQT